MIRIALILWLLAGTAMAQTISGLATVTDGDTIRIGSERIRLFGIDAPERSQTCEGRDGQIYECGRDASAVMTELTRGRTVTCSQVDRDRYGRMVATCSTESGDLGAAMVQRGWAVDFRRYDKACTYCADEAAAKAAGIGMHAGRFEMPEDFRRTRR